MPTRPASGGTSGPAGPGAQDFPRRTWHSPAVGIVVEESPAWVIAAAEAATFADLRFDPTSLIETTDAADDLDADDELTTTGSKRRPTPEGRRRANIRTAALTALGAGLAIALPAVLRLPHGAHMTLNSPEPGAPSLAAPQDSASPTGGAQTAPHGRTATKPSAASSISTSAGTKVQPTAALPRSTAAPTGMRPATAAVPPAGPTTQISADLATAYENQVVVLTNAQRAAAGCGPLRIDDRLQAAAIAHSVDMRARRYFAHDTPDGVSPWTRMADAGYTTPSAENIAMGQATPQDVVTAWMNSPGHRANILSCSSKAIGVGVQFGPGGPWWTQDFGYV